MSFQIDHPHCKKCHHSWWYKLYNWKKKKPIDPPWCACCNSSTWDEPYRPGHGPQPGDKDAFLAFCPVCNIQFWSLESWFAKQQKISEGAPPDNKPPMPIRVQTVA
ncbi:MAG: hypothetical protein AB1489_38115 [Acidobacteriota bacterium]